MLSLSKNLLRFTPLLLALPFGLVLAPDQDADDDARRDELHQEVLEFVDGYLAAFNTRDEEGIRAVCSTDDSFAWYEDGTLRYESADAILEAFAAFPEDMSFTTEFRDTRVRVLSTGEVPAATIATLYRTEIGGSMSFVFEGAQVLVLQREEESWRIVLGHSSSARTEER